jgi:hypothetical protein
MLEREQTVLMRLGVQEMMNMTFESGIDKVDTAEAYASGRSEEGCLLFYGPVYALTLDTSVEVCYQETHMATYRPGHHHQVSLGAQVRTNGGGHSRKQYVSSPPSRKKG